MLVLAALVLGMRLPLGHLINKSRARSLCIGQAGLCLRKMLHLHATESLAAIRLL